MYLLHHLIANQARRCPQAPALLTPYLNWSYARLLEESEALARGLTALGLAHGERVAVWLPKSVEGVALLMAISCAGGVLVPINPLLKEAQVAHILKDSGASFLISHAQRLAMLEQALPACHALRALMTLDHAPSLPLPVHTVAELSQLGQGIQLDERGRTEQDLAALLYTSGSTGRPKGVMLSHRNLLAGAASVAQYLALTPDDRLLAALPLSFDYGFSQLTVAFSVGASVMPIEYLLPNDVRKAVTQQQLSVLAGVPTLWQQLAAQPWLEELTSLRVLTNSGGRLPRPTLERLRTSLPQARIFLMYGLTEAFRSTFLPPEELERRPDSIGRAIPNAEIFVLRPDGSPCAVHEPGELVHRGPTVALGYWNDPERSAERFRALPVSSTSFAGCERAVWSGDRVWMDEEGFLYFLGREDDMIKSSGYRISPTEVEEVLYASGWVREVAVIGLEDEHLGQQIVAVVCPHEPSLAVEVLFEHCRRALPSYMQPHRIELCQSLPHTPHGKIDRPALRAQLSVQSSSSMELV